MKCTENVIIQLKEIIDNNGPDYLTDEPYKVYLKLVESDGVDRKTAGAVLYFLVNGGMDDIYPDTDPASLSKAIQSRCCLNKKMADELTAIFLSLYSQENKEEWKEKELEGLAQFLKEEFICMWDGHAVWDEGNGTVDCYYDAEIVLSPKDPVAKDDKLSKLLRKNPFMEKDVIREYFETKLSDYLDREFEEYCTCDDYYQPVVEDFEAESYIKEWCSKNGFEFVSCEGDGDDSGYEPKFRKGWY